MDAQPIEEQLAVVQERYPALAETIAMVRQALGRAEHDREEYRKLYQMLLEENERLKRGLLGQKAERLQKDDAQQLSLAVLGMMLGQQGKPAPAAPTKTVKEHERRKPTGRKGLPDNLPEASIELLPEEVKRQGLDAFERIGEQESMVLERRPQSLVRVRIVRPKFVPRGRKRNEPTQVLIHEPAELPIERGSAGPGMLADTVVRRWDDHAPLNRLERIYARDGVELARSTMCTWHDQLAQLAEPLIAAIYGDALGQPYLCADATGVLVQAKQKCRRGHFWVLVAPGLHVLFRFSQRHDSDAVDQLVGDYQGYLVVDAPIVYEHLFRSGKVIEVACWSHARRYFWYSRSSDPERANIALGLIGEIFRIERSIADASPDQRRIVRQQKSRPVVESFFGWCDAEKDLVLDESPISKAIGYASNQKAALQRFLENGSLPAHNNMSELQLRRQALGRRNWIFVGSEDGAKANTTFVTLLASCRIHKIEPWAYLRDLFCLLPSWPRARVLELAPAYWKQTFQQQDTQRRLAQNVFRQVTLPVHQQRCLAPVPSFVSHAARRTDTPQKVGSPLTGRLSACAPS